MELCLFFMAYDHDHIATDFLILYFGKWTLEMVHCEGGGNQYCEKQTTQPIL